MVGKREVEAQHQNSPALCSEAGGASGQRKGLPAPRGAGDPTDLGPTGVRGHPAGSVAQLYRCNGVVHHPVDDEATADASDRGGRRRRRPGTVDEERQPLLEIVARPHEHDVDRVIETTSEEGTRLGTGTSREHHNRSNGGARLPGVTGKREELFVHGAAMTAGHGQRLLGAGHPFPVGVDDFDSTIAGTSVVGSAPVDDVDGEHPTQVVHQHEVGHVLAQLGSDMDRPVVAQRGERIEHLLGSVTERMLEFVEMVDGRSDDGHGDSPFGQADRLSSARGARDLSTNRAVRPHSVARGVEHQEQRLVGVRGFEPPASTSRTWRANQAALHPVAAGHAIQRLRVLPRPNLRSCRRAGEPSARPARHRRPAPPCRRRRRGSHRPLGACAGRRAA